MTSFLESPVMEIRMVSPIPSKRRGANPAVLLMTDNSYGPVFGHGTDFGIRNGCLGRHDNWCHNKSTYHFNNENMNGEISFNIIDYEVYLVIFD